MNNLVCQITVLLVTHERRNLTIHTSQSCLKKYIWAIKMPLFIKWTPVIVKWLTAWETCDWGSHFKYRHGKVQPVRYHCECYHCLQKQYLFYEPVDGFVHRTSQLFSFKTYSFLKKSQGAVKGSFRLMVRGTKNTAEPQPQNHESNWALTTLALFIRK